MLRFPSRLGLRLASAFARGPASALALAFALILASGAIGNTFAATIHVPTETHPTIQAGIFGAQEGDTILVAPGIYTGEGNRNIEFFGLDLVLVSEAGPEQTILDVDAGPGAPARGFRFQNDETPASVLDGFTIRGGYMSAGGSGAANEAGDARVGHAHGRSVGSARHVLSGGGIQVNLGAGPTLRNLIIEDCRSDFTGGGISIEIGSAPRLENVTVVGCEAGLLGGGISVETGSAPVLREVRVTGNYAPEAGGILVQGSATIERSTVAGNRADRGGGLYCDAASLVAFDRVLLFGNCADDGSDQLFVAFTGTAELICSGIEETGVLAEGTLVQDEETRTDDPRFCDPEPCLSAPTRDGDYRLDVASTYTASGPCGRVGAHDVGCDLENPTHRLSWGRLKVNVR